MQETYPNTKIHKKNRTRLFIFENNKTINSSEDGEYLRQGLSKGNKVRRR